MDKQHQLSSLNSTQRASFDAALRQTNGTRLSPQSSRTGHSEPRRLYQTLEDLPVLPHLLPKDSAHPFNQPVLRHPDLTAGNIFVSPETSRITCLIDWQHAIVPMITRKWNEEQHVGSPDDRVQIGIPPNGKTSTSRVFLVNMSSLQTTNPSL